MDDLQFIPKKIPTLNELASIGLLYQQQLNNNSVHSSVTQSGNVIQFVEDIPVCEMQVIGSDYVIKIFKPTRIENIDLLSELSGDGFLTSLWSSHSLSTSEIINAIKNWGFHFPIIEEWFRENFARDSSSITFDYSEFSFITINSIFKKLFIKNTSNEPLNKLKDSLIKKISQLITIDELPNFSVVSVNELPDRILSKLKLNLVFGQTKLVVKATNCSFEEIGAPLEFQKFLDNFKLTNDINQQMEIYNILLNDKNKKSFVINDDYLLLHD